MRYPFPGVDVVPPVAVILDFCLFFLKEEVITALAKLSGDIG
jgi:hypothetical protein